MQKKSIFLVIICLFIGAVSIQLSAQSENATEQGWWHGGFYTEVYCDGVELGIVSGHLDFHWVDSPKNEKYILQAKGEGVADWSGETFTYKEIDKVDWGEGIYSWVYHLKGDMGSRFMGHVTWNTITNEVTVGPTSCK